MPDDSHTRLVSSFQHLWRSPFWGPGYSPDWSLPAQPASWGHQATWWSFSIVIAMLGAHALPVLLHLGKATGWNSHMLVSHRIFQLTTCLLMTMAGD